MRTGVQWRHHGETLGGGGKKGVWASRAIPCMGFCSNPKTSQASHCVLWVSAPSVQGREALTTLAFPPLRDVVIQMWGVPRSQWAPSAP